MASESKVLVRILPGGGREIEIHPNGESVGELMESAGIDLSEFQIQVDGTPAVASTRVEAGASVVAAPNVKGA